MAHKKIIRFAELNSFPNVLQFPKNIKGKWNEFFKNANPVVLELACGKGEYAVGLGFLYRDKNFIGIDLKGNRIWVGAKRSMENNLHNVAFLRAQIDHVNEYFSKNEVDEIWIIFPDPQLRKSKAKKRLTHPKFLRLYQQFLKPGGYIHLKTDSPDLYNFTKTVIRMYGCILYKDYPELYRQENISKELQIKTHYETLDIAQSNRVHYLCFSLPQQLPGKENEEKLKELLEPAYYAFAEDSAEQGRSPAAKAFGDGTQASMKDDELTEGIHYYINEEGLIVLTELYHKKKGYCCGMGCLHCPYQYENVPEPRRSVLLKTAKPPRGGFPG